MENILSLRFGDSKQFESMPESIEFYEFKLEEATKIHEGMKAGTIERRHSYSLTYAKKDVNEAEQNLKIAKKL